MKPFFLRKAYSIWARVSLLCMMVFVCGSLQAALQDNWAVDHAFEYKGDTQVSDVGWMLGFTDSVGNVYSITNYDNNLYYASSSVTKYDISGVFVRQLEWTSQKTFVVGSDDSLMLWDNSSPMVISTRNADGVELSRIETGVMAPEYLNYALYRFFARDTDGNTYVADSVNSVVKVFNSTGTLSRTIGERGSGSWQLNDIRGIAVGRCDLVAIYNVGSSYVDRYIKLYRKDGTYVNRILVSGGSTMMPIAITDDGLVVAMCVSWSTAGSYIGYVFNIDGSLVASFGPQTGAVAGGGIIQAGGLICNPVNGNMYTFDIKSRKMLAWRRAYRTFGAYPARLVPLPGVRSVSQRENGWIDIDYIVNDGDSATVHTALAAYKNGTGLLKDLVPISSANLIDSTGPQLGSNIATGSVKRLTWNPSGAGLPTGNLTFEVFAKDDRPGLLDVDYIKLPGTTTLISRSPLTHGDMRAAWAWLLATGNAALSRDINGEITGPGGTFTTTVSGESRTTAAGRAWLFAQLGAREATTPELTQARKATASSTPNEFDPNYKQQINGRPKKVNEWIFDSYSGYGSEVWWLVKLP